MGLSHPAGFVFFLSLFRVLSSVWIARDMRSQSVTQKTRHRKVSGFLFSDGRRTGRRVAVRDRYVGPGEFISAPGARKSCGFRILHEI